MRTLVSLATIMIFSGFGSATLADCKNFQGRLTNPVFEACEGFEVCITTKATGTLAGEQVLSFIGNTDPLFPFPFPSITALTVSEVVWHTNEGDVFGTDLGVIDFVTFNFASLTTITGGTSKWEGATGQVINAGNVDGTTELSGQICTP